MRRLAAAAAVAAALVSAGCARSGGQATALPAPEKPNLVVAVVPTNDSAGLYIAAQRGYFAQRGLHVTIKPAVSSDTVINAQLHGQYDVTGGNYVSYIRWAALNGAKLRILAAGSVMGPNIQMLMVPAGSPITSIAQLKGKKVAVNVKQNIGTVLVDSVFTNNAILPSPQNIHYVAIPFPFMAKALQSHQVDAAWMPEPFVTEAEESIGAQPLADTDQGLTQNLPITGYVVTQAWAKKYPRTFAAFKAALLEGQRVADTDTPAVVSAVVKYAGVPQSTAAILATPSYPLRLDAEAIQRVANLMLQFNVLPHGFSVAPMLH